MAGFNNSHDVFDYGVDGSFQEIAEFAGRYTTTGYSLDFQAKASTEWEFDNDAIKYDLEVNSYNDIVSRGASQTSLILILLCLPRSSSKWHLVEEEVTTFKNACFWHWFSGDRTSNTCTKRIRIPRTNIFSQQALIELMAAERARREAQIA